MPSLSSNRPADFDAYWEETLQQLAKVPPAPELAEMPLRSTDYATAYSVRLTSIGPYRIFAYLSIPHGDGPFPAKYNLPRYGSVVELVPQGGANAQRREYVTCSIGVRGQRGANQPYEAAFPGLFTQNIDDSQAYVFRGIVADCCRGLEFLMGQEAVDRQRVVTVGNDLALTTAALCPQVTHVVCAPAFNYATSDVAPLTEAYPLEEINDYLRYYPSRRAAVERTLSYFDLRWFAPRVKASTLLMTGTYNTPIDGKTLEPLVGTLGGKVELHETEHSTYKDGLFTEEWLTRELGLSAPILPEHWQ